jgi:hypothetical protein
VFWGLKFRNVGFWDTYLHQKFILSWRNFRCFLFQISAFSFFVSFNIFLNLFFCFDFLNLFWLFRSSGSTFDFHFQSVGSGLNWHTRAMESERPYSYLPSLFLVPNLEFWFRHWKCMSKMQISIHVRIWKCNHVFFFVFLF